MEHQCPRRIAGNVLVGAGQDVIYPSTCAFEIASKEAGPSCRYLNPSPSWVRISASRTAMARSFHAHTSLERV